MGWLFYIPSYIQVRILFSNSLSFSNRDVRHWGASGDDHASPRRGLPVAVRHDRRRGLGYNRDCKRSSAGYGRSTADRLRLLKVMLCSSLSLGVNVEDSDTIDDVKERIIDEEGLRPIHYTLAFDAFHGRDCCKVTVNVISGASFRLEVAYEYIVGTVKAKIQRRKGIPQDQQQLLFDGVLLENNRTLREYNVQNESTLTLVLLSPPTGEDP